MIRRAAGIARAAAPGCAVLLAGACATAPPPPPLDVRVVIVEPPVRSAPPAPTDPRWSPERIAALRDSVRAVLALARADSAFPGAYAVIGSSRGVLVRDSAGALDWAPGSPVPTEHTLWDLASLTKVVGLTTAIAQLVAERRVELDAPAARYLPEFGQSGKGAVTVRQLLAHASGLPNWRPLHKEAASADSAVAVVMATPLDTAPGVRMVYSDLGLIALGRIVERVTGEPLDRHLASRVFEPLGMRETMYNPPPALRDRIAPTEIDPWRQRHLRGEVHDENAFFLGGVAGHAGLFSSAHDLARFARMYLNHGTLDGVRVLDSARVAEFTAWQDSAFSNRGLGWQKRGPGAPSGRLASSASYGHTGFTGTSLWIDPVNDVFIILLTNRVNPTRMNTKIGGVRARLADAVMSVVLSPPSPAR